MQLVSIMVMLWYSGVHGANNAVILKTMSLEYGRKVYPCLKELHLGQDVLTDFLYYWQADYQYTNKDVGCTVLCVKNKLNLLEKDGKLSKTHAEAWVRATGGDDNMAQYLTYLYQSCQLVAKATEPCDKALEVTNCFRTAVQRAQWSPDARVQVLKTSDG